jgi:hypothetical protein
MPRISLRLPAVLSLGRIKQRCLRDCQHDLGCREKMQYAAGFGSTGQLRLGSDNQYHLRPSFHKLRRRAVDKPRSGMGRRPRAVFQCCTFVRRRLTITHGADLAAKMAYD